VPIETAAYLKRKEDAAAAAKAIALAKAAKHGRRAKKDPKAPEVPALKSLKGPDAIHLATASLYPECTQFHTFDGEGRSKGTALRLLDLNGVVPNFKMACAGSRRPQ
jgi:predicted nucleic acid-binding protein